MLALAIAAIAPASVFAPPLGVPIRVVNERSEGDWHFRSERLVRFAREGAGYRAELWLTAAGGEGPDRVGSMMEAGFAGLAGHVMVFHLDAAGKVVGVDDLAMLWTRFCDGVARIVKTRSPDAEPMVGPLRTLPPARQMAMLASLVTTMIAEETGEPAGVRPVRVPASSPYGGHVTLEGTRSIERLGITQRATTRAAIDLPPKSGVTARVEMELVRDSDPATGLVTSTSERVRTRIGERGTERLSTVRVTAEPATIWPGSPAG